MRLKVLQVLVLSLLVTLLARLWYLQVLAGNEFASAANANRVREIVTPAARGLILDDTGQPLALNRTAMVVSVNRTELAKQKDKGAATLAKLGTLLNVAPKDLADKIRPCGKGVKQPCWNGSPLQPVPVLEDAPPQVALRIAEHSEQYPGVTADFEPVRDYPGRTLAAQALGYLGPITSDDVKKPQYKGYTQRDLIGKGGLEAEYEKYLRGKDGVKRLAVDRMGHVIGTASETQPQSGGTLVTNIDAKVQQLAEQTLATQMADARTAPDKYGKPYKADTGAVVVLDATNGAVVALASNPSYDANVWTGGITQAEYQQLVSKANNVPLLSRATQGEFAPGSTFKMISSSAMARSGDNFKGSYDCPNAYQFGTQTFHNFESEALGTLSLREALIKSCDTVFYKVGYDMWVRDGGLHPKGTPNEYISDTAHQYGLGAKTGIDLPEESAGRIPDRAEKKANWVARKDDYCAGAKNPAFDDGRRRLDAEFCTDGYTLRAGDAVNEAIGQGDVLLTPLQLAAAYAAMANGGTYYEPQIGKAVIGPDGKVLWHNQPKAVRKVQVPASGLNYIRSALGGVTQGGGTAYAGFLDWPQDKYPVGGKTGTAEVGLTKTSRQDTSWFVGFAPVDHPKYVVAAMLEEVGQGRAWAAKTVRGVMNGLFGVGQAPIFANNAEPGADQLPVVQNDGTIKPAAGGGGPAAAPAPLPDALTPDRRPGSSP